MKDFICSKCGNRNPIDDAEYCIECGFSLLNFCTNPDCEQNKIPDNILSSIPNEAKFCPYCGSKSTYYDFLCNSQD